MSYFLRKSDVGVKLTLPYLYLNRDTVYYIKVMKPQQL